MRWSLAKLDGHVVVAPACVDSLERYFPFDYEYIPNGVDADRYRPEGDADRRAARATASR